MESVHLALCILPCMLSRFSLRAAVRAVEENLRGEKVANVEGGGAVAAQIAAHRPPSASKDHPRHIHITAFAGAPACHRQPCGPTAAAGEGQSRDQALTKSRKLKRE